MQEQNGLRRDLGARRPLSPLEAIEPTRAPTRPGGRKRKKRKKPMGQTMRLVNSVLTALLIILIIAVTAHVWLSIQVSSSGPLMKDKLINIARGKSEHAIASLLEKEGIIASRHIFLVHQSSYRLWEYLHRRRPDTLKAGDYEIKASSSVADVAALIRKGKTQPLFIAIPEGLTSYAIVRRLRANKNLTGDIPEVPPEGFLMPATYDVQRNASRADVLQRMAEQQRKFLRKAWQQRQPDLPYKDVSEALIMASIVQREMGPRDDPARIAGVFINRLRRGMRLQSDPTILYGKYGSQVAWRSTIYRSYIREKTTHNTYQIDGLPPTPICNPGRVAIQAALNPAQTKALYFVADGKGGHIFSETLEEHNRAVEEWRKIERRIREAQKAKAAAQKEAAQSQAAVVMPIQSNSKPASAPDYSGPAGLKAPDGTPLPQQRPR
ncbi:MAG: endolytic transglycosylase MltG [Pseudomonadota bacterium]